MCKAKKLFPSQVALSCGLYIIAIESEIKWPEHGEAFGDQCEKLWPWSCLLLPPPSLLLDRSSDKLDLESRG